MCCYSVGASPCGWLGTGSATLAGSGTLAGGAGVLTGGCSAGWELGSGWGVLAGGWETGAAELDGMTSEDEELEELEGAGAVLRNTAVTVRVEPAVTALFTETVVVAPPPPEVPEEKLQPTNA